MLEEIRKRDAELDGLAKLLKVRPNDIELRFQTALACLSTDVISKPHTASTVL